MGLWRKMEDGRRKGALQTQYSQGGRKKERKESISEKPGKSKNYKNLVELIKRSRYFQFKGFIEIKKKRKKDEILLGVIDDIKDIIKKNRINSLVITRDFTSKDFERGILELKMKGLQIYNIPFLYEEIAEKLPVSYLSDFWVIFNTFYGILNNLYNIRRIPTKK